MILLNAKDSIYYEETKRQALSALAPFREACRPGRHHRKKRRGVSERRRSHVIVTSYVSGTGRSAMRT